MKVRILTDSITDNGHRLTTWELKYARFFHSEVMTHRDLSRNAASSRAIPAAKLREAVASDPAIPIHWGARQAGMQADNEVADTKVARAWWAKSIDTLIRLHEEGEVLGLHKQVVNRIIEPGMQITLLVSATNWANFFHLRNHKDAEPNFQALAKEMWEQYHEYTPTYLAPGDWHMPLVTDEEKETIQLSELRKISTGRCARVSYLTHDGKRDTSADAELHDRLAASGHMSPFEHVAVAVGEGRFANFEGWRQYRSYIPQEAGPSTAQKCWGCGLWTGGHTNGCPMSVGRNNPAV